MRRCMQTVYFKTSISKNISCVCFFLNFKLNEIQQIEGIFIVSEAIVIDEILENLIVQLRKMKFHS